MDVMITPNVIGIREHARILKFGDVYDLWDPVTGAVIGEARERMSLLLKLGRMFMSKRVLPVGIDITLAGMPGAVATIRKGWTFWRAKVEIRGADGGLLGVLQAPVLSLFTYFNILSEAGEKIGGVKGNLMGWNYTIEGARGELLGTVGKQWAGIAREVFTSADRYVVGIEPPAQQNANLKTLVIATAIAIDSVFKESGGRTALGAFGE